MKVVIISLHTTPTAPAFSTACAVMLCWCVCVCERERERERERLYSTVSRTYSIRPMDRSIAEQVLHSLTVIMPLCGVAICGVKCSSLIIIKVRIFSQNMSSAI